MKTIADLWRVILEDLNKELSSTSISTWFDEVVPIKQEDSILYLYCPNSFKQENLERFYLQHLQKVLKQRFSSDVTVSFVSEAEYAASLEPYSSLRRKTFCEVGKFTFDTFVVGESNRMAYNAAQAVAVGFDEYCNPLVIYGTPGLGKTHLLNAIAAAVKSNSPDIRVVNLNCSHYGSSSQLNRLDERIASRFEGGLLIEIKEPEYDTRLEIVRRKSEERGLLLHPNETEYIAEKITGSVRRLEGLLNKLKALGRAGSTAQFGKVVDSMVGDRAALETPDEIIDRVARAFRVEGQHIKGKSRSRNIVAARQVTMYIMCHEQGLTTSQVGRIMGRDHSTVVYALQTVDAKIQSDETFSNAMKKLMPSAQP